MNRKGAKVAKGSQKIIMAFPLRSLRPLRLMIFEKLLEMKSLLLEDLHVSIKAFEDKLAEVRVSL